MYRLHSIFIGIFATAFAGMALAGRYDPDPGADGGGYLLWIPLILAGVMYTKFEKSGHGTSAAIAGGVAGIAVIYFFPLLSAIIVAAAILLFLVGYLLNW
jgi:hypothetical protein